MADSRNPLVSVIIPTYKRSDYLDRAIKSVINQTYSNIEIIVVDDNNPDTESRKDTNHRMEMYENVENLQYIKNKKNLGGALARNQGIEASRGSYIAFLDDDDIFLKDKIQNQLDFMLDHNLELSFSNVAIANEKGKVIDYREHSYLKSMKNDYLLKNHLMHHLTPTGTYIFKKTALLSIGGFDNASVGQEFRLMLKAISNNLRIGYFNETNLVQFVHSGERISIGENKIQGEKKILELKKTYFDILSNDERKYILFRYRAMLAVVGIRSKKPFFATMNLIKSLVISPKYFIKEIYNYTSKIKQNKKQEAIIIEEM